MKTKEEDSVEKRIVLLKSLSFRLKTPADAFDLSESAYKRRGVDLLYIPHSSVKIAKDFDESI